MNKIRYIIDSRQLKSYLEFFIYENIDRSLAFQKKNEKISKNNLQNISVSVIIKKEAVIKYNLKV